MTLARAPMAGARGRRAVAAAALVLAPIAGARAQHASHAVTRSVAGDTAEFLARAREGSARYRELEQAVADGFRPLGPDFPGMAQHWISVSRLMRGGFDAARPHVLSYARIGGAPTLVGVAWTVVLSPGESPPPAPAGAAWHEHQHSIDEESAMLHQLADGAGIRSARLAMLHGWVWLANADGVFASDNWAVPFARAGLAPPATSHPAAARALSLLGDGGDYWAAVARVRAGVSAEEERAVRAALAAARDGVAAMVGAPDGRRLTAGELEALAAAWTAAWERAADEVAAVRRTAVRELGK